MKRLVLVVAVLAVLLGGCSGVVMNAEFSTQLDKWAASSKDAADRAEAGAATEEQKTIWLRQDAKMWKLFQDARDGKEPE